MQQLDAITLHHLAQEYHGLFHRAKIVKVQQWSRTDYVIHLWFASSPTPPPEDETTGERLNKLFIHLNPEFPFCTLATSSELARLARAELARPTGFCMALRKHLTGGHIHTIRTLPGEQVLDIIIEHFNELGNRVRLVLSLELMGKFTNMLLYDEVSGHILATAHSVSDEMSRRREVRVGIPYHPPPRPEEKLPLALATLQDVQGWTLKTPEFAPVELLTHHLWGVKRAMVEEVLSSLQEKGQGNAEPKVGSSAVGPIELFQALQTLVLNPPPSPGCHIPTGRFSLLAPDDEEAGWQRYSSVSVLVHRYTLQVWENHRIQQLKNRLTQAVAEQEKKRLRHYKGLVPVSDGAINQLQHLGDLLLLAHSQKEFEFPSYSQSSLITLEDPETREVIKIPIDPAKSWTQNAQDYYRKVRKAKAKKAIYEDRLHALETQKQFLEELQTMIQQADRLTDLDALRHDLIRAHMLHEAKTVNRKRQSGRKPNESPESLPGLLVTTSLDGYPLWVGRSSQANGWLVGKLSRPDDEWLHVHNQPGSHVLIKRSMVQGENHESDIPNETLLDAANLAIYFSPSRDSANVSIIHTQSKFVRKITGSYPGHVTYRHESGFHLTVDPIRIKRLLEQGQSSPRRRIEADLPAL